MSTTAVPFRPATSARAFQFFVAVRDTLSEVFQRPATAESDVWKLYRMARGTDSVSPAVIKKLSRVAAAR